MCVCVCVCVMCCECILFCVWGGPFPFRLHFSFTGLEFLRHQKKQRGKLVSSVVVITVTTVMDRPSRDRHRKRDRHVEKPCPVAPVILTDTEQEPVASLPALPMAVADESFDHDECVLKINRGHRHVSAKWVRHLIVSFRIDDAVIEAGLHDIRQQLARATAPPKSRPRPDVKRQRKSSTATATVASAIVALPVLPASPTKDELKLERAIARMKNEILKDTYAMIARVSM